MEALGVEPYLTILQVSAERRDRWTFALHRWMKCSFWLRSWKRPHFKKRLIKQLLQNSWSQMWRHAASLRIIERAGYVWGSVLLCEIWRGKGRGSRMQLQTEWRIYFTVNASRRFVILKLLVQLMRIITKVLVALERLQGLIRCLWINHSSETPELWASCC